MGHTLIDNVVADLRQAVNAGFPRPKIAALDRVDKQPPDAVAVVGIILGGVDASLGGDAVSAPGTVLNTECFDVVTEFSQGSRKM